MTTISIPSEVAELSADAESQIAIAKSFVIAGQQDYQLAADQLKQLKSKAKIIETKRKEMTAPLDATKKAIMDFFRPANDFLAEAESIIKAAMLHYSKMEEQRRLVEERKAREEAARIEAEARAKAEKEAAEAMVKAEAEAEIARATGNDDIAEMILERAETTPLPIAPITVSVIQPAKAPTVQGASIRKNYYCEVVDKIALCRAIAEGKASPRFMVPDMAALNNEATHAKDDFVVPGCEVMIRETVVSR